MLAIISRGDHRLFGIYDNSFSVGAALF